MYYKTMWKAVTSQVYCVWCTSLLLKYVYDGQVFNKIEFWLCIQLSVGYPDRICSRYLGNLLFQL